MKGPNPDQRNDQLRQARRCANRICDAWPLAMQAAAAIGYPTGGEAGSSSEDPVLNAALKQDRASRWLVETRRLMAAWCVSAGVDFDAARFKPNTHRALILESIETVIKEWPHWTEAALSGLVRLANVAAKEWPPTPRRGDVIDGVTVGERSETGDTCSSCGRYIAGSAADPVRRIDGAPYHKSPCWETVRKRRRRAGMSH
jgi:hypothetical protein